MHNATHPQTTVPTGPKKAAQLDVELLTDIEAAELLGQQRRTLAIWRTTGRYGLPFVKIGRKVFYRASDLESFIAQRVRNGHTHAKGGE